MLMELDMLYVKFIPVKIMTVADATVAPQKKSIRIVFALIHKFLLFKLIHEGPLS